MTGAFLHASSNNGEGTSETITRTNICYYVIIVIRENDNDTICMDVPSGAHNVDILKRIIT